jgi:RNA polymerase sigma-70 factor (ECF subfamily)
VPQRGGFARAPAARKRPRNAPAGARAIAKSNGTAVVLRALMTTTFDPELQHLVDLDDLVHLDDDGLLARINAGDVENGLAVLKDRHGARVLAFVHGIVHDRHLAEDVWQEVLAKVFFKSHLYRPGTNFRAWLFEIARNQALTALRNRRRTPQPVRYVESDRREEEELAGVGAYFEREIEEAELMAAFEAAVAALPERYRDVFELCVRQGRQYQETARLLGIPSGTVAIRVMRARQRLFRELGRHIGRLRQPPACLQ